MRLGVREVRVLVGLEPARDLLGEAIRDRVVALGRVVLDRGRRDHDLGAVRAQGGDLLLAHLVGHHEDAAVALVRGRDREADAGVARGRLDDRPARLEPPVGLGRLDHREPDPILVRATRVEELELRQQRRARLASRSSAAARSACCRSARGRSGTTGGIRDSVTVPAPLGDEARAEASCVDRRSDGLGVFPKATIGDRRPMAHRQPSAYRRDVTMQPAAPSTGKLCTIELIAGGSRRAVPRRRRAPFWLGGVRARAGRGRELDDRPGGGRAATGVAARDARRMSVVDEVDGTTELPRRSLRWTRSSSVVGPLRRAAAHRARRS